MKKKNILDRLSIWIRSVVKSTGFDCRAGVAPPKAHRQIRAVQIKSIQEQTFHRLGSVYIKNTKCQAENKH